MVVNNYYFVTTVLIAKAVIHWCTVSSASMFYAYCLISFQLISAGVLDKADYPDFDEETGVLPQEGEDSGM